MEALERERERETSFKKGFGEVQSCSHADSGIQGLDVEPVVKNRRTGGLGLLWGLGASVSGYNSRVISIRREAPHAVTLLLYITLGLGFRVWGCRNSSFRDAACSAVCSSLALESCRSRHPYGYPSLQARRKHLTQDVIPKTHRPFIREVRGLGVGAYEGF